MVVGFCLGEIGNGVVRLGCVLGLGMGELGAVV